MDKLILFNNIIHELSNKVSAKTHLDLKALYETLASKGQGRSGFVVDLTYKKINENVSDYIEELIRQINDNIKDYEIILSDDELNKLFDEAKKRTSGLLERLMAVRKDYLDANGLADSRIDYKTIIEQNCIHKLDMEKQNLHIKMYALAEKKKQNISIEKLYGQLNMASDQATINANNMTSYKYDLDSITNGRFGFRFLHPRTWDRFDPQNGDGNRFLHPSNENIYISGSGIFSMDDRDFLDRCYEEQCELQRSTEYKLLQSHQSGRYVLFRDENYQETSRMHLDGYKFVYTYVESDIIIKTVMVKTQYKNVDYTILCNAPEVEFKDYEDMFNYIISEFVVIDGAGFDIPD